MCLQCGRPGFDPWVGKIPWRRAWQPTPVFLPGASHGQRSLAGYSPWGRKESDMTERLSPHTYILALIVFCLVFTVELWVGIMIDPILQIMKLRLKDGQICIIYWLERFQPSKGIPLGEDILFYVMQSLSCVWLFCNHMEPGKAPLSLGQEYWSGLPFVSPGDFPNPGIKPGSPALWADAILEELSVNIMWFNWFMLFMH